MEEIQKRKGLYEALGHLVHNFAGLDFLVRQNLWLIYGVNNSELRDERNARFSDVIKNAKKGAESRFEKFPDLLSQIISLLNESEQLNRKRNEILHSSWWEDSNDKSKPYSAFRLDKKIDDVFGGEFTDYTNEQIHEIADAIKDVRLKIFNLLPQMLEIVGIMPIEGMQRIK
jgi:hypothetical protein